ncbi:MAG: hypothetical protein FWD28_05750 [Treponema sp.]|nr:hypothetical protein [Treponema sp.]
MNRLVFLPVPEIFKKEFTSEKGFPINPDIPIPAVIPAEPETDNNEAPLAKLEMDMIISGMLRAIEEKQVKQEWIDYYCGFVLFLRPDILEIVQTEQEKKNI